MPEVVGFVRLGVNHHIALEPVLLRGRKCRQLIWPLVVCMRFDVLRFACHGRPAWVGSGCSEDPSMVSMVEVPVSGGLVEGSHHHAVVDVHSEGMDARWDQLGHGSHAHHFGCG